MVGVFSDVEDGDVVGDVGELVVVGEVGDVG